jgi:hypothetical protein
VILSEDELAEAFEKTLGCPMLSMRGATPPTVR